MDAGDADDGRLEGWSLSFDGHAFLAGLPIGARLAAAAQLKFLDRFGHFPSQWAQIGDDVVAYLAEQLGADTASAARSEFDDRTARRHRERILTRLGLRRMTSADRTALDAWLAGTLCPVGGSLEAMIAAVFARCCERRLQPPARAEVERQVRAARRAFRERLLALMLYCHSLRLSEAEALTRADVDLAQARLWVRRLKGALSVERSIHGDQLRAIKRWLAAGEDHLPQLFVSGRRQPVRRRAINDLLARIGERAGRPHMARATPAASRWRTAATTCA